MLFANLLSNMGTSIGKNGAKKCFLVFVDEPKCPKSLIK